MVPVNVGAPETPTTIDELMVEPPDIVDGEREKGEGYLMLDKGSSCCGLRPPSPCSLTTAREILGQAAKIKPGALYMHAPTGEEIGRAHV